MNYTRQKEWISEVQLMWTGTLRGQCLCKFDIPEHCMMAAHQFDKYLLKFMDRPPSQWVTDIPRPIIQVWAGTWKVQFTTHQTAILSFHTAMSSCTSGFSTVFTRSRKSRLTHPGSKIVRWLWENLWINVVVKWRHWNIYEWMHKFIKIQCIH